MFAFLDPRVWIALAIALAVGAGVGYWKGGRVGAAQLAAYKAEVAVEVMKREAENARVQRAAELAADAAAADVQSVFDQLAAVEERVRVLLADPALRVSLPPAARRVFNASTRPASKVARPAAGADGKAGTPESPAVVQPDDPTPVDLNVLLETSAENHREHLRCVAQVEGWQRFYGAVQSAYNEGLK